jgi:hypothetical protein
VRCTSSTRALSEPGTAISTAALLWTHNEPDVLIPNIRYLLTQVDEVMIRDRNSERSTIKQIRQFPDVLLKLDGDAHGYNQSQIMTEMALEAMERGHEWVLPIDPDEIWHAHGRPLREALGGMSKDVGIVKVDLYNHLATAEDEALESPFDRMHWRQRFPLALGKVACRTRPDLVIEVGNHFARTDGVCLAVPGLVARHFPYRTEDQFIERVRTAYASILSSDLPLTSGIHVRAYGRCLEEEGEEALRKHFRHWFYSPDPGNDDSLTYDPAPIY